MTPDEEALRLYEFARPASNTPPEKFVAALDEASLPAFVRLVYHLHNTHSWAAEAAGMHLQQRLTERLVGHMTKLDAGARKLWYAALALAAIQGVAAILTVVSFVRGKG